ncbi:MAG: ATP-binding protein [Candidatus Limnocylindrales bacterium]
MGENVFINRVRDHVAAFRQAGYPGVTTVTRSLLAYWSDPDRAKPLFFCQIEALETATFWGEVAGRTQPWIENQLHEDHQAKNTGLYRRARRLATGAGKSEVGRFWDLPTAVGVPLCCPAADARRRREHWGCAPSGRTGYRVGASRVGAAAALFQVVSQRYGRGSIALTTNLGIASWGRIFNDPTVAAAMLDRLLHRSVVFNIDGDSYRMRAHRARAEQVRKGVVVRSGS